MKLVLFYFVSSLNLCTGKAYGNCLLNESIIHSIIFLFCSHVISELDQHQSQPNAFINYLNLY